MDLLKPKTIVLLGKSAGRAFGSYLDSEAEFHIIPRGIGDSFVPREGLESMERIISELLQATG